MAVHLAAKATGDTIRYGWTPPVVAGDTVESAILALASGTITLGDEAIEGGTVYFAVAGGAAGEVARITASATTGEGETLTDTLYVPVKSASSAFAYTVRDVCGFALRKIVGNGNDPDGAELDDAVERLADMLASWTPQGADVGVALPLTANTVLYVPDAFVSALKHNLRVACHEHYGQPVDPGDAVTARRGLQLIKAAKLPTEREGAEFY